MKILLMGDSITDMGRANHEAPFEGLHYGNPFYFGMGYAFLIESVLATRNPMEHTVINKGMGGHRVVDIYARIKADCWNWEPDVLSILIGVNDVWHEAEKKNGVEIERYEKIYRAYIEDTKKALPNVKIMLLEPFTSNAIVTESKADILSGVKEYAKVVKRLAEEYGAIFVPLQDKFDELFKVAPISHWLYDGVHTSVAGAKVIADEWLKAFDEHFN